MTREQIEEMLEEVGVPFRYHHFTQKEMQDVELPIVVWTAPKTDNFYADGIVYVKIKELNIEVYADQKDWELEEKVEEVLTAHGIPWQQTASAYLDTEQMWETLYEMGV